MVWVVLLIQEMSSPLCTSAAQNRRWVFLRVPLPLGFREDLLLATFRSFALNLAALSGICHELLLIELH